MEITDKTQLEEAIKQRESTRLEFKAEVPSPLNLAKSISAFHNTDGGSIVVGVNDKGDIIGIETKALKSSYERARKNLSPYDISSLHFIEATDGKIVGSIVITNKFTRVVGLTANGIAYERMGPSVRPITAKSIIRKLKNADPPMHPQDEGHISDLALKIEELNSNLIESNSWRSKIKELLIGALLGAILSIILTTLFEMIFT